MRLWRPRDEPDVQLRQKLDQLKHMCPTALAQPVGLFKLVLRKQMGGVNSSAAILNWMFGGPELDAAEYDWARDEGIGKKADRLEKLMERWIPQGFTRSTRSRAAAREPDEEQESPMQNVFIYFVAQATSGNDQVNEAYENMLAVYRT